MTENISFSQKLINDLKYEREILIAEYLMHHIDSRSFITELTKIDNKLWSYQHGPSDNE